MMNLSFAGCGFLGIYHVGVSVCFRKYAPHILLEKISGASFGAISACCLLCDLPLGEITNDVLRVVKEARSGSLGPFSPSFNVQNVLLEGLQKFLPDDAHIRVSGKLHISLTRVYDGKNVIVSQFNSKEDLLQALLASCFIPVFSGLLPPRFHGIRYMDGGFSDNLPVLDENTITVSPFCGESDICPRDLSSQLFHVNVANTSIELSKQNINRFARILFPPKPEVLSNMCKQGFDDALRFLHRTNMISCTRCLTMQSTYQLQEALDETMDYDPECKECKTHRQEALVANLPDTVMTVFQNAIETANKGLINWVFKHRGMKVLSIMSIPYRLPADIVYATFTKLLVCTPMMSRSLWKLSAELVQQVHGMLYGAHDKSDLTYHYRRALARRASDVHKCDALHATHAVPDGPVRRASYVRLSLPTNTTPAYNEDDTFENILRVTDDNDALLQYYYMDDDNKMKLTEIYDVTESEAVNLQSPTERDANHRLEFDNEWTNDFNLCDDNELSSISLGMGDELQDRNLFSEPESEWERPNSPPEITELTELEDELSQPESDQAHKYMVRPQDYALTH